MKEAAKELKRLRSESKQLKGIPYKEDAINDLIEDIVSTFSPFLPNYSVREGNNKWVHSFGISDAAPVSVERVHGNRDAIPISIRSMQMRSIRDALDFIEREIKKESRKK